MSNEFDIIKKYFCDFPPHQNVILGIGDDAAIVRLSEGYEQVVTTDTLVSGVHFPVQTSAEAIGYKSLAVNLSDLAAMGARPSWFTLALTLPEADSEWLEGFSRGLKKLADRHQIALIGGDTTRGPLSVTIQACGSVPQGSAIKRNGAQSGDDIYVTGTLGDAGLGLASAQNEIKLSVADKVFCENKLNYPEPRVMTGEALLPWATSMIDCSDGFAADLGHMLEQSQTGAEVQVDSLPLSNAMKIFIRPSPDDLSLPLTAGDDFELIFTVAAKNRSDILSLADMLDCSITRVGKVIKEPGLFLQKGNGELFDLRKTGYQHFE